MNIGSWLQRRAAQTPEAEALFLGSTCVASYQEFERDVHALAQGLIEQGLKPGDRVAIVLGNVPEYLVILYAIWYAGAVAVPINAKLHQKEVAWIVNDAGASLIFGESGLALDPSSTIASSAIIDIKSDKFQSLKAREPLEKCCYRAPSDLAWLFYTSGTTGQPKGVRISHRMLISMAQCYFSDVDKVLQDDAALYAAPMSHGAGLYNFMHVLKGARHVFPHSGGFDAGEIFDLAEVFGSIHIFAAPTMVKRMTTFAKENARSGTGLRSVIYAGGPMYEADIIEAVTQFGDIFVQIYGQGECPMGITALSRHDVADRKSENWRARLASVGTAQSGVEVQIGDENGGVLPVGAIGEIMVRGDTVMAGYWNNSEASAKTLVDGWLFTGDIGFKDEAGYVTLVDRSKDVIISGGSNIYPREVEEVLLTHSEVSEASVIGQKHPEWGEEVVAFVVMSENKTLDFNALDNHCLNHIARFKRPKRYIALTSLPKNNYGKVLKTALREKLQNL